MSDDRPRPIEPEAPAPPTPAAPQSDEGAQPAYAMPVAAGHPAGFPAGYPGYVAVQQRPRFADQVLGMRAVIAVAIACLIIGGLSGAILGRASADNGGRFGGPGGFFQQRGALPDGAPGQPFGQGQGR